MLNVEEKVAVNVVKVNSNQNKHIVAPPQCQVKRHMSNLEDEYELVDFRVRSEPVPWNEVKSSDRKTLSKPIMAKSALRNYQEDTTKHPAEEKVCNVTQVRFNVPKNNNKMQSI